MSPPVCIQLRSPFESIYNYWKYQIYIQGEGYFLCHSKKGEFHEHLMIIIIINEYY